MDGKGANSAYHWNSQVETFIAYDPKSLAKVINEFYKGRFVVGTQVFRDENAWVAFVYFKVRA